MTPSTRGRAAALFATSAVGQATVDRDGVILDANRALADLLGYPLDHLIGRPILGFAHPDDSTWDAARVVEMFASPTTTAGKRTRRYVHASGRLIYAQFSAQAMRDDDGDYIACSAEDVTAFVAVERQNRLLLEVLGMLAHAPDFSAGVQAVLARLCADTGWSLAQLWLPAGDGDILGCAEAWHGSRELTPALRTASQTKAVASGEGFVGGAWESGRATWWHATDDSLFTRAPSARADGLRTGVAIPLLDYGRATGVIELFSADVIAPHDPIAEIVIGVAQHLGPTLSRRRDEQTIRDSEHRLRALTDGAPVPVVTCDGAGRVVGWNAAAEALFGVTRAGVTGRPVSALVTADLRDSVAQFLAGATGREPGDVRTVTITCLRADGATFPAEISVSHWDWLGSPHFTAIFRDVSAQQEADRSAAQHSERLAAIVAVQNEVLRAAASVTAVQQLVVDRAAALFGCDGAALELLDGDEMVYVAGAGSAAPHLGLRLAAATSLSGLSTLSALPQVCDDTDGDDRVDAAACRRVGVRAMLVVPLFDEGNAIGALKVISAVPRSWTDDDRRTLQLLSASIGTALLNARRHEQAVAQAEKALYDELTGLPRRELLSDRIRHAHRRMRRNRQSSATFFIDLDGFKAINDNFGHAVGDELLVAVAARLSDTLRGSDTAARFGGDEFVAFCEDVDAASVIVVAQRLVETLNAPYQLSERAVTVTASIGVVVSSDPDDTPDAVISRADEAMYLAKRGGKARASFAVPATPVPEARKASADAAQPA